MSPSKYIYYDNIRQNVKKVPMNGLLGLPTVIVLRFTNRWKEFTYIVSTAACYIQYKSGIEG